MSSTFYDLQNVTRNMEQVQRNVLSLTIHIRRSDLFAEVENTT